MSAVATTSQAQCYREFLMARGSFDPRDFRINMDITEFTDLLVEEFHGVYRDSLTKDGLLLHPRESSTSATDCVASMAGTMHQTTFSCDRLCVDERIHRRMQL